MRKEARVGMVARTNDDGQVNTVERIFKIIRECNIEFDSEDEEAIDMPQNNGVERNHHTDKQ